MNETPRKKPFEGKRMPAWLGFPLFAILGLSRLCQSVADIRSGMSLPNSVLSLTITAAALLIAVLFGSELCRKESDTSTESEGNGEANNTSELTSGGRADASPGGSST